MAYTAWSVVAFEQPTAAKWNQLGENDAGFKDGTNIDNDAILERHIGDGEVTAPKLGTHLYAAINHVFANATGNETINVGFQPRVIIVQFIGAPTGGRLGVGMAFLDANGNVTSQAAQTCYTNTPTTLTSSTQCVLCPNNSGGNAFVAAVTGASGGIVTFNKTTVNTAEYARFNIAFIG